MNSGSTHQKAYKPDPKTLPPSRWIAPAFRRALWALVFVLFCNPMGCYLNLEQPPFACSQDTDCPSSNLRCVQGACVSCNASTECGSEEVCRQNQCQACGSSCTWSTILASPGKKLILNSVQVDKTGDVFVTGSYQTGLKLETSYTSGEPANNAFIAKVRPPSKILWVRSFRYDGELLASTILPRPQGSLLLQIQLEASFGSNNNPAFQWDSDLKTLEYSKGTVVIALDNKGTNQWFLIAGSRGAPPQNLALNYDKNNNLYIAGNVTGSLRWNDTTLLSETSKSRMFVFKLNSQDKQEWFQLFENSLDVRALHIVNETLLFVGEFSGNATWGSTKLSSNSQSLFVAQMTLVGDPTRAVQSQNGGMVFWRQTTNNKLEGLHILLNWRPIEQQPLTLGKETLKPPTTFNPDDLNSELWVLVSLTNNLIFSKARWLHIQRSNSTPFFGESIHPVLNPAGQLLVGVSSRSNTTFNDKQVLEATTLHFASVLWDVDDTTRTLQTLKGTGLQSLNSVAWGPNNGVYLLGLFAGTLTSDGNTLSTTPNSRIPSKHPSLTSYGYLWHHSAGGNP